MWHGGREERDAGVAAAPSSSLTYTPFCGPPSLPPSLPRRAQEATIASQLLVAVRTRNIDTLRRLCSGTSEHLAAALKRRDGQGHTLMHWAAKAGEVEMLELLASESKSKVRGWPFLCHVSEPSVEIRRCTHDEYIVVCL